MGSRILVNGAKGKMGTEAVLTLNSVSDLELVLALDKDDELNAELKKTSVDVALDLTYPVGLKDRICSYLDAGLNVVVGATGLTESDKTIISKQALAVQKKVLLCPNFSISALLMMKFSVEAAKYMPRVEIIEYHHDKKVDAPSGTAIKTAEMIQENGVLVNEKDLEESEVLQGARGGKCGRIPIHALRLPGIVADQDVIFGGIDQTFMLRQTTLSRKAFMPGVLLALRGLDTLKIGLTDGLEHLLQ